MPRIDDITTDPHWQIEQTDRLIGFEMLQRMLRAEYQQIPDTELADRVCLDRLVTSRIINNLKKRIAND